MGQLVWEDVEAGQKLPSFTYELSLLRLVAFARASGLYDYVHIDRDYAHAAGARDAFISTPHVAGLLRRLLTGWSGPDGDIRALTFAMRTQSCANDMLTVSGIVARTYRGDDGAFLVDIDNLSIGHAHAEHAVAGSATMALPSRSGEHARLPPAPLHAEPSAPSADVPDFARPFIGRSRSGGFTPARPLTRDEIHLWCEALEDWNPLYWDEAYAATSRHRGIVAPATGYFLGSGSAAGLGVGYMKPGVEVPDGIRLGLTGLPLLRSLRQNLIAGGTLVSPPGCPEIAVVRNVSRFFAAMRPGDTARTEVVMTDCSPKKTTRLGEGYFITSERRIFNQRDEPIRTFEVTIFHYHV